MKNPFRRFEKQYLWYCTSCSAVGRVGINPDTVNDTSVKSTCHNIHNITTICKARLSSIKIIPLKKK